MPRPPLTVASVQPMTTAHHVLGTRTQVRRARPGLNLSGRLSAPMRAEASISGVMPQRSGVALTFRPESDQNVATRRSALKRAFGNQGTARSGVTAHPFEITALS